MSEHYNSPSFKSWLDRLQQESWQLELIISGFAIYGLAVAYPSMEAAVQSAGNAQHLYNYFLSFIALLASSILLFNLILHVILRGIWIGALGLRYVFGDIKFEKLNYSEQFTSFLKKRIVSFDRYIAKLEDYCSILFAISFLLIFYVLSCMLLAAVLIFILTELIKNERIPEWISNYIGTPLFLLILIGSLLTFIDFITLGLLKKNKYTSKIYFPIYRVLGLFTLSFLYRPLVYNLQDNPFGKRISFLLMPVYGIILFVTSVEYQDSNYLLTSKNQPSTTTYANSRNYDDLLHENDEFVRVASIPSKVIRTPYLKLFIIHTETIENQIFDFNKTLKPKKDLRGLKSSFIIDTNNNNPKLYDIRDSLATKYLRTFNKMRQVYIDSVSYSSDFIISANAKSQIGFESYIKLNGLKEGKHTITVKRNVIKNKDTITKTDVMIPFWYFRE